MPIGRYFFALLVTGALAGCGNARVGEAVGEGSEGRPDSSGFDPVPDAGGGGGDPVDGAPAPPIDAGLVQVQLTHSASLDVVGFTSVTCFEAVNSYYRVFDLAAEGITGPLDVDKVTFGVEECVSGSGGLQATVLLHTLDGPLRLANLTQVARQDTVIPDVAEPGEDEVGGLLHEVPMSARVPAGSVLVVEVTHPGLNQDQQLLMGANRAGQDGPTFLRAPECDTNEPTDSDDIEDKGGNNVVMHWVLVVDGRTGG